MLSENAIAELIKKPLEESGYTLISVKFKKEGRDFYLQIVIDRFDDIGLDDIVDATNLISPLFDAVDVIDGRYILDVTSLGAEKPIAIADLSRYIGRYVNVHLTQPIKGANSVEGELLKVEAESVQISYKEKTRTIVVDVPLKDIDKARLAIKF